METDTEMKFKKVPASELRLDDDFMKYQPKTKEGEDFKNLVEIAIKSGLKDFWCPVCDPSFDRKGRICYEPDKEFATGKRYKWWKRKAKKFCPERKSRLGTKNEYFAYLATVIKELVEVGKPVEWAWNAVSNEKRKHYWKPKDAKHEQVNCYKLLAEDEENGGFFIACGFYNYARRYYLKASLYHVDRHNCIAYPASGWIILEKD